MTSFLSFFPPSDAASRKWKATCTSNRLTQAHWHRHLMAKLRSGLVVCKSTKENSQHTVGSNLSLFLFNIVAKCSQLNKIDRKLVYSPWCCLIVHIIYFSFALLEEKKWLHPGHWVWGSWFKKMWLTVNFLLFLNRNRFLFVMPANSCF